MSSSVSYSEEQAQIALNVLSKDKHAFYDILEVEKKASDGEIKKAYRKLAIKLHPDKNPHPRASEAFKVINRAFEVLGDEEKRQLFDRIGRDPDDRAVPTASSASGFSQRSNGQFPPGFENMFFRGAHTAAAQPGGSPEDIFDFLFNMNGNGGFGGGNPFMNNATTFTFGPGGFRAHNVPRTQEQRQRQRQAQQQHDQEQRYNDIIRVIAPLLLFFLIGVFERFLS